MTAGINLEFVANVSKFLGGTKDVEGALGKVSDALDEVAKDAQHAGDKAAGAIGDAGKDMTRTTGSATAKMEQDFAGLAKASKQHGDNLGETIGSGVKRGTDEASEGTKAFKENASQNFKETAASFTGSADDIANGAQGMIAELLEGFGPAGIAAGVLLAAGLGKFWNDTQEKSAAAKKQVADMFSDMAASGQRYLSESFIQEQVKSIIGDDKQWKKAQDLAKETGLSVGSAMRAMAGDTDFVRQAQDKLTAAQQAATDKQAGLAERYRDSGKADVQASQANAAHIDTLTAMQHLLEGTAEAQQKATAQADAYSSAQKASAQTSRDLAQAHADYTTALDATAKAAADNGKTLDATTEAGKANRDALLAQATAAAANADALVANGASALQVHDATLASRDALIAAAEQMGATKGEAEALATQYGLIPTVVKTRVEMETGSTYADLMAIQTALRQITGDHTLHIATGQGGQGGQVVGRATGGSVAAGTPYVVGEERPELFVPGQSGTVLNAAQLAAALGRTGTRIPAPPTRAQRPQSPSLTIQFNGTVQANNPDELARKIDQRMRDAIALYPSW